jgi:hypothetical protein
VTDKSKIRKLLFFYFQTKCLPGLSAVSIQS